MNERATDEDPRRLRAAREEKAVWRQKTREAGRGQPKTREGGRSKLDSVDEGNQQGATTAKERTQRNIDADGEREDHQAIQPERRET